MESIDFVSDLKRKRIITLIFVTILFSVLLFSFYNLQISSSEKYEMQSEKNRIREEVIKPARGLIFERNGILLVDNRPTYSVSAIPFEVIDKDELIKFLDNYLNIDKAKLQNKLKNLRRTYQPIRLLQIDFKDLAVLEERRSEIAGVIFQREPMRYYPREDIRASHILGYAREVSEEEIKRYGEENYQPGDIIGKEGLEKQYENLLRGKKGYSYIEVDFLGRIVREIGEHKNISPELGNSLWLTLDRDIQQLAENELKDKRGAIVVLDTKTSGILAMASSPDYDPNSISDRMSGDTWRDLLVSSEKPLFNTAIKGIYPPGSVLKPVLAIAAINEDIIDLNWSVNCPGYYQFGNRPFKCWFDGGHGKMTLLKAIQQSCDVFFYRLMLETDLEIWVDYMNRFGFGQLTGIDLPDEEKCAIPDNDYLDKKYGKNGWTRGQLLNLSIGQGDALVTPIQLAMFVLKLANNGNYYKPHLLDFYEDIETGNRYYNNYEKFQIPGISDDAYEIIKKGMEMVVNTQDGTAKSARVPGIKVAGKTGTAQNPHGEDHAIFMAFAPSDNPEIAISVIIENAGMGSAMAAPVAGRILRYYFRNKSKLAIK